MGICSKVVKHLYDYKAFFTKPVSQHLSTKKKDGIIVANLPRKKLNVNVGM